MSEANEMNELVKYPRWEYLEALEPTVTRMDELGEEGWEAVCVIGDTLLFKRPRVE